MTKSRRGLLVAAIVGSLLLLGGAVTWLVGSRGEVSDAPMSTTQPSVATGKSRAVTTDGSSESGSDAGASSPHEVPIIAIALEGVPEKARVLLDGERVVGHTLERPRSKELHEVQVEAEGFVPWSKRVSFERDASIAVTLSPAARLVSEEGPSKTTRESESRRSETPSPPRTGSRKSSGEVSQPVETSEAPIEEETQTPETTKRDVPRELEPDPTNPYGAQ
jgi:hypothetical protein